MCSCSLRPRSVTNLLSIFPSTESCSPSTGNGLYAELIRAQKFDKKPTLSSASSFISGPGSDQRREILSVSKAPSETNPAKDLHALDVPKNMSALQLIRRCITLSRGEVPVIALGLIASIISGAISIGEAFVFGNLVELLNSTADVSGLIARFCLLFFGLAIVALLARVFAGSAFGFVSENLVLRVRDISFRTVLVCEVQLSTDIGSYYPKIDTATLYVEPHADSSAPRCKILLGFPSQGTLTTH